MMESITDFQHDKLRKILIELSFKRNLLRDTQNKFEELSITNVELQQSLDIIKQQLKVTQMQNDSLKNCCEKLRFTNIEQTVDEKVELEAKKREATSLRQQNLELHMENLRLKRLLEDTMKKNATLSEMESKIKEKQEDAKKIIEQLTQEQEKLVEDHQRNMEKSNKLVEQRDRTKFIVDYHEKRTAVLSAKNEELQKNIKVLSDEIQKLKVQENQSELHSRATQNHKLSEAQKSLHIKQEQLNYQIESNSKLRSALTQAVENTSKLFHEKAALETQLKKLNEKVESAVYASEELTNLQTPSKEE